MANKEFFTRIQHKHDTVANWEKATTFVPKAGEIIVYDPGGATPTNGIVTDYPRIKIGDGVKKVNELDFYPNETVNSNTIDEKISEQLSELNFGPLNLSTVETIKSIKQDGGKITVEKQSIAFPAETKLSLGTAKTDAGDLEHYGEFTAVSNIEVNNHTITPTLKTFQMPAPTINYVVGSGSTTDSGTKISNWKGTSPTIKSYFDGLMVAFKIDVAGTTTTYLNINNLGDVEVVRNSTTDISTAYPVNSVALFVYTTDGGTPYWKTADYDTNTTYTNVKLGHGFCYCTTDHDAKAKTVTLSSYTLTSGGIIAVRFTRGNTSTAMTLNVNSKGALNVLYNNSTTIPTNLITENDVVVFQYYSGSTYGSKGYHILSIVKDTQTLALTGGVTGEYTGSLDVNTINIPTTVKFDVRTISSAPNGDQVGDTTSIKVLKSDVRNDTDGGLQFQEENFVVDATYNNGEHPIATTKNIDDAISSLANALHFLGVTTTQPPTITINSKTVTSFTKGDVVIYGVKEYIYDGSAWKQLGDENIASQAIAALNYSDTPADGQYVTAVSESAGKISVSRTDLPTDTVTSIVDDNVVNIKTFTSTRRTDGGHDLVLNLEHAKTNSPYTSGNTTTEVGGSYGASTKIKIPQLTVDDWGHVVTGTDEEITITMPSAQTIDIDGVKHTSKVVRYGTCSTAAGTVAKTASITSGTFVLETGARATVKFTNANTGANPTLNINSTGAKKIFYNGAAIKANDYWSAGDIIDFIYDGTQWNIISSTNQDKKVKAKYLDLVTPLSQAEDGYPLLFKNTNDSTEETSTVNFSDSITITKPVVEASEYETVSTPLSLNIKEDNAFTSLTSKGVVFIKNGEGLDAASGAAFSIDGIQMVKGGESLFLDPESLSSTSALSINTDVKIEDSLEVGNRLTVESGGILAADGIDLYSGDIILRKDSGEQIVQVQGNNYTSYLASDRVAFAETDNLGTLIAEYGPTEAKISQENYSTSVFGRGVEFSNGSYKATMHVNNNGIHLSHVDSNGNTVINSPIAVLNDIPSSYPASAITGLATVATTGSYKDLTDKIPYASSNAPGIITLWNADSCSTFTSDDSTCTPLAVQKGAKKFAITRPSSTTEHAITRYTNTTGDVENSKIIIEDVTNTRDTSKTANVIAIPAEGNKKMVYGYCTDQVDGTSFIGGVFPSDATEYPYAEGLAIGGTSGNLLWKGKVVATINDIPTYTDTNTTKVIAGNGLTGGGSANSSSGVTLNVGAGTGITVAADTVGLATVSGLTAGTYGPSAAVTGSDGATMNVPQITVDAYGRVTSIANKVYTAKNTANTDTKVKQTAYSTSANLPILTCTTASPTSGNSYGAYYDTGVYINHNTKALTATKVYGAVWNDYAEYRNQTKEIEPGYCVASGDNGKVYKTTEKFQACDGIVSDTFGFGIGETDDCKTPLAVAGRVLAYAENPEELHSGDTVCAGPNGKVIKMTREEIHEWPDRIVGVVSEIPTYETWGTGNVPVNGRIWIKVK